VPVRAAAAHEAATLSNLGANAAGADAPANGRSVGRGVAAERVPVSTAPQTAGQNDWPPTDRS
jgi:hypothetical protein